MVNFINLNPITSYENILLSVNLYQFSAYKCTNYINASTGADEGKDAKIWSIEPNVNFGDFTEIRAMAWTWFGEPELKEPILHSIYQKCRKMPKYVMHT